MTGRSLVLGTLVGTLVLFVWQTISHTAIPWHDQTMRTFADDTAAARAVRAHAPENGVYLSARGVMAVVAMDESMSDQAQSGLGLRLGRQAVIDLIAVAVLVLLLAPLGEIGVLRTGIAATLAALPAVLAVHLSNWNWFGFTLSYATVNVVDQAIGFFLTGLALGALWRRRVPRTAEMPAVRAEGELPTARAREDARV